METPSSNGHTSGHEGRTRSVNPYADAAEGRLPPEIVEYQLKTNPYANMLPGISSINAARTVGEGVEVGRRGNRLLMLVSVVMLLALLLPLILAVIAYVH